MKKKTIYIFPGLFVTLLLLGCISLHDVIFENKTNVDIGFYWETARENGDSRGIVKAKETKKLNDFFPKLRNKNLLIPIIGKFNNNVVYFKTISWNELKEQDWKLTIYPKDIEEANQIVNDYVNKIVNRMGWDIQERYAMLSYLGVLQIDQEINDLYKKGHLNGEVLEHYEEHLTGKKSWKKFLTEFHWYAGDLVVSTFGQKTSIQEEVEEN
jgi:hypothetical protein